MYCYSAFNITYKWEAYAFFYFASDGGSELRNYQLEELQIHFRNKASLNAHKVNIILWTKSVSFLEEYFEW